jgi:hypothetical protein
MDRFLPIRVCSKLTIRISALQQPRPRQSFHPLSSRSCRCRGACSVRHKGLPGWSDLSTRTLQNDLPKRSLRMDRLLDTSSRFRAWWREKKHTISLDPSLKNLCQLYKNTTYFWLRAWCTTCILLSLIAQLDERLVASHLMTSRMSWFYTLNQLWVISMSTLHCAVFV